MKFRWAIALVVAIAAAIGLYVAWQLTMFPIFGPCAHELVARFPSIGRDEVVVYVTDCGATTSFAASAAYGAKNAPFDPKTADDFFRMKGRGTIEARWPAGRSDGTMRLEIIYPRGSEVFRQAIRWNGTIISYTER